MGASDAVEAAFRAVVEETARVYALAAEWLRGQMGLGERITQREAARRAGYSVRQIQRAVRVLRERLAAGMAA